MNLNNKTALVTGGARIGATVAETLARRGADIVLSYRRSKEAALKTAARVQTLGRRALVVKADVSRDADVRRLAGAIRSHFGRLDVLVNMASVYESTPWPSLNEKKFEERLASDLKSVYLTTLHMEPLMKKEGGRIVNFADWVAASGRPRYKSFVPYYTAKSAVIGLTQALALELSPKILVNAIAPGPILPPAGSSQKEQREVERATPLGRWGGPDEIAKAVAFLAETDFVTGDVIRVDGGRHLL